MAKKQLKTAQEAASAAPAAGAKPGVQPSAKTPVNSGAKTSSASREPRVTASKHSRGKAGKSALDSQASEALAMDAVSSHVPASDVVETMNELTQHPVVEAAPIVAEVAAPQSEVDPREAIAKLAYSYYEGRGYAHGNPEEDWVRAEREYYGRN